MQVRKRRIAGMATMAIREKCLKEAVASIYDQMDEICIILNMYDSVPDWLAKLKKVNSILGDNSLRAEGKFFFAGLNPGSYYFSVDDAWCIRLDPPVT